MDYKLVFLNEQKYMGIKTTIFFADHDNIDFRKLQLDVINSDITNRALNERFMAMDSDYQADSFSYTPLVPVTSFEGEDFYRFTRVEGEYYCFEVRLEELGPQWFQKCFQYMEQNNLKIEGGFDLEYYPEGYMDSVKLEDTNRQNQTICLIFRKQDF